MKRLPKKTLWLILGLSFFLSLVKPVQAQNKAGIHIGDHFGDFDQAADIVGPGGWVVVMACPGDGDTIAAMISQHPKINLVIRGHYPGQTPDADSAKQWAATLGSLPGPNKIYFVPWNEPNQYGSDDWALPQDLVNYTQTLIAELGSLKETKVILLSPMLNHTFIVPPDNPRAKGNYDDYVKAIRTIKNDYFTQFEGIAMNLYDIADNCGGTPFCSNDSHYNPLLAPNLLSSIMGVSNKPIYGVESGTAGNNFYWRTPPDKSSPLYQFVSRFLSETNAQMFAIPAYDLGGEVGHTWNLFDPPDVVNLLETALDGSTTPGGGIVATTLNNCPGKNYSFYVDSQDECGQCGSAVSYCKPIIDAQTFGEEISRESINIPEEATYRRTDGACLAANFSGKIELTDFKIPFARDLNKYFLGELVDNPKSRLELSQDELLKEAGLFNKLAPPEIQDNLKLKFLDDVANPNYQQEPYARYVGFQIEGKSPAWIATEFRKLNPLKLQGITLDAEQKKFFDLIWPQVPLIANEESRGHVVFYASGIEEAKNILDTSVPEVYRLNEVTTLLNKMFVPSNPSPTGAVQGTNTQEGSVLATETEACLVVTSNVPKQENIKEGKTGLGNNICTKPEIQPAARQFEGKREWENEPIKCQSISYNCSIVDEGHLINPEGRCCSNGGKCVYLGGSAYSARFECQQNCTSGDTCSYKGINYSACCVPDNSSIRKEFETNLNSINKVPFLDQIAKNTISTESGFFNIYYIPYLIETGQIKATLPELEEAFREVVGESAARLRIEIDQITKTPDYQEFKIGDSSTRAVIDQPLTLLFYKLGTLINVKDFISKKLLIPAVYESE